MSTETNKAAVLRQVEALSTRDLGMLDKRADELYTADYIVHDPGSLSQGGARRASSNSCAGSSRTCPTFR